MKVNNGPSLRGSAGEEREGLRGAASQGLDAGRCWEGAEMCVRVGVCAHRLAAEGQRGHKVAVLQC